MDPLTNLSNTRLVDSSFATKGSTFPNEFVSPLIKELPEYGAMYAKSIYAASGRFGGYVFWNDTEYQALLEVSQGRQSIDKLRNMFGFFRENKTDPLDDGSSSLAYLDIQVLNLAPKYVNRAVAKIMNLEYDVQLEAVDSVSVHEKKQYEANLQAFYEFRGWLDDLKISPKELFPDLDIDILPEYPDELMYEMLTNPKMQKAIDGEEALTLMQQINDFNQKMRMMVHDKVVYGRGHIHCYRDENGIPRIDHINPKYYVGSYVEDENFEGQEYAGFFDFPTVSQFRKEASGYLTDEEIEEIVQKYAYMNNIQTTYSPLRANQKFDGLNYIPVLRFYFLSQDDRVFVKRNNKNGNPTIFERSLGWKPSEDDPRFGQDGDSDIIRNSYTSVYGGTWILDSDLVYNYGKKEYPRSNLVDLTLPIKTFAPLYKEGRTVSFCAQMIEPLFMINVAWNKIKQILAQGFMGVQEIDFTQLEKVALGKGGQAWTPREVYKHFLQTGRLIKRSPVNKYDQQYSGSAVEAGQTGLQMSDYLSVLTTGINMLEQLTGTTVAESTQMPDRLPVRVMEQSQATGDLDMEYLFNSYTYMYRAVCTQLLGMVQQAKRDGIGIAGFIPSLGKHVTVSDRIALCDYGLFLVKSPSGAEWQSLWDDLQIGLQNGTLTHLDVAYIKDIKNLKKARQILGIRVKVNERKAAQINAMNQKAAMDANRAAAADKAQGELYSLQAKGHIDEDLIKLKGQIDEHIMVCDNELKAAMNDKTNLVKQQIAKQTSVDEIIKKSVENKAKYAQVAAKERSDKEKSDSK
ncbi:MAG TPA: hypothetical protein VL443_24325 [Cyclobacteriaceae bacterium]|jgi:hypothetical protein|nr:hypothetical protein [Cyclobacteriaceae bacterium]